MNGFFKNFKVSFAGEAGMVAMIIAILSLMVFPLPTWLIDLLLGVNITISVVLLMVTIYVPSAVSLTSFPALLLFTTLFRLSLNIASTKLILLNAEAGHIIETFGNLVVGGNMVVGIVVFLIITIVQFIVIAKGSERVAEVGARFTLDAMPGKQMSIDADMRAGHLTADEARKRRAALAMESQLHGGMDGAMKFVKGDAIAGLVITLINIVAGIIIGVTMHNMTSAEAANRFSILSVGDAMVSQIPSLLICVAAGVMITRVADEHAKKPKSLGGEIATQLSASPRALYLSAGLLGGFALVPGFPWYVFLVLGGALAYFGHRLSKSGGEGQEGIAFKGLQREGSKSDAKGIEEQAAAFSAPLAVTVSPSLKGKLRIEVLDEAFEKERVSLQERLGLPFPGIRLWTREANPTDGYEVLLHDVPAGNGVLKLGKSLVLDAPPELRSIGEKGGECAGETSTLWLEPAQLSAHKDKNLQILNHEQAIAHHAIKILHEQAHQFLGIQEVHWILERVATDYPGLVEEVKKVLPLQRTSEVLRRLLEEQLSIRNMRAICESLIVWGPKEKDVLMLTEYVRGDLGRYLGHRATDGTGVLSVVLLEPQVEKMIREAIKPTPAGNYLALAPDVTMAISKGIRAFTGNKPRPRLAVVTSMDIRRYVRRLIEAELKWLAVYSYQELGSQVRMEPLGKVSL